ncbi:Proteasome assembly chaperone 4, partial [Anas platyrhynchos]
LHDFSGRLGEQRVHFHAMRLRDSLFLWVDVSFPEAGVSVLLCVSVCASSPYFLCSLSKLYLNTLFCVLARKTKKQIFVSYNLQNTDSNFTLLIENRIKEEMTAFPEKF